MTNERLIGRQLYVQRQKIHPIFILDDIRNYCISIYFFTSKTVSFLWSFFFIFMACFSTVRYCLFSCLFFLPIIQKIHNYCIPKGISVLNYYFLFFVGGGYFSYSLFSVIIILI